MVIKEIKICYDFKGSKSEILFENEEFVFIFDDEFKFEQLKDVLIFKFIKCGVFICNILYGKIENVSGGMVR